MLLRFLTLVGLAGVGFTQTPTLTVHPPGDLYVSSTQAPFSVEGRHIENDYPDLTVYLDEADVTASVGWNWSNETRVDLNSDGWLEGFSADVQLDLTNLVMGNHQVLRLEATTDGVLGLPVSDHAAVRALGHSQVDFSPGRVNVDPMPAVLHVALTSYGIPLTGVTRSITIRKDGVDVTPSVSFLQTVQNLVERDPGVYDWRSDLEITTSSLGTITEQTQIEVEMSVTLPAGAGAGTYTSSSTLQQDTEAGEVPCAGDALCAFLQAMSISHGAGGGLEVGNTDKESMRKATEDLRDAIRACQSAEEQGKEDSFEDDIECDGMDISVILVIGGNAGSGEGDGAVGGSTGETNTLIVVIGGDGEGDGAGGFAEARGGDGSVAIGMGGRGAGTGKGGRGTSEMDGNGMGVSFGGRGGTGGGQGGNAFTNTEPSTGSPGGQGVSGGGPGGHDGPASTGGHGGGAGVKSWEGDVARREGGPKEGGAGGDGEHGSGACAQADEAGNASATRGTSVPN